MSQPKSVRIGKVEAGQQPQAADLVELKKQGFKAVVNLRQSSEVSQGLTPEQESRLATELGLGFVHLPISVDHLSEKDVRSFEDAIAKLPAPVYVHCGLGQRAATFALLADGERSAPATETIVKAEEQGIAITPKVRDFIDRYFEKQRDDQKQDEATFARLVR